MRIQSLVIVGSFLSTMMACGRSPNLELEGDEVTLELAKLEDGSLETCDATIGKCQVLPYDGQCDTVEVVIDTTTGATCERCLLPDGSVIDRGCGTTSVACARRATADPACVVCAYVDGSIVYSTCVPREIQCDTDVDCPRGMQCLMRCRAGCANDSSCSDACEGTCVPLDGPLCVEEGGSIPVVPEAPECCAGLALISCDAPGPGGDCNVACQGAAICARCGNGECGLGENQCNCPADCS